jgi:phosphatidylserine/phosphatidylglycerophosphate/cardiolipin synthase-like enzyme
VSAELELRFLREGGQTAAAVAEQLAAFLGSARRDVAIAIYDFHVEHEPPQVIARTLQGLRDRVVRVRILDHDERRARREVPDNVPRPAAPPEYVDSLGLDVKPVSDYGALMHHKYAVVDGERVWTGSLNWTEDSFTRQENCVATIASAAVAAAYLRDFEELWKRPRHLDASGRFDAAWTDATFAGAPVRVRPLFCPGRGPELASLIGSRIACARERVLLCSPVLTSGPILGALSDVVGRGAVPVTGVVDRTQMRDVLRQWGGLPKASWKPQAFRFVAESARFGGKDSVPWGPGTVHDFLHAKLVVCDDWAFAGSHNHSRAGEENAENVLAIEGRACADLVAETIREFAARYALAPGESWAESPGAPRASATVDDQSSRPSPSSTDRRSSGT